ncbi:unnamed protein product [Auanema sp. JU1783]|nr:unnamed protein product [Auanema sp. JU1783]
MASKLSLIDRISVQLAERAAAEGHVVKTGTHSPTVISSSALSSSIPSPAIPCATTTSMVSNGSSGRSTPIESSKTVTDLKSLLLKETLNGKMISQGSLPKADRVPLSSDALNLLLSSHFPLNPTPASVPGKRPASPEETQPKRARLSPESSLSIKTENEDSFSIATETEDSMLSLSALSTAEPSPVFSVRDESIFCQVPGRLALLNNNSKYPVTINEIRRRLGNPERLNASILGGVLRRAKSKNGGKELRDQLEQIGLDLPAGKRKAFHMTLFTAMVEGEATHLAKDFDFLCETEFPVDILSEYVQQKETEDAERNKRDLEGTVRVLSNLLSTLRQDRAPVFLNSLLPILPERVQDGLTHFSLCTHGFGTPAFVTVLNTMMKYAEKSLSSLRNMENTKNQMTALNPADIQAVWKYVIDMNNMKAAGVK